MANDLTRTPWIIDTASATTIKSGLTFVKDLTFSGYASGGDTAVIQDDRGRAILTLTGLGTLNPIAAPLPADGIWIRDIKVTTLGSGIVTIWT